MTRREQIERLKKRRALLPNDNKKIAKEKHNEKVYVKSLGRHPLAKY